MPNSLAFGHGGDSSSWATYGAGTGGFPTFSQSAYNDINSTSDTGFSSGNKHNHDQKSFSFMQIYFL